MLSTADGKNNGSLGGVAYFVTEPDRGVFCRLNKLTREQNAMPGEGEEVTMVSYNIDINVEAS